MATVKRIVCLANSRKLTGRCIAGKELVDGKPERWIRPVSSREHEEVSEYERQYEDGSDPDLLDIIDVPLLEPRPRTYQQENWLLDSDHYWVKAGRAHWNDLYNLVDPEGDLWTNGCSSYNGHNDRIPLEDADNLRSSLRLVRVEAMTLRVFMPGEAFGNRKRRLQCCFHHHRCEYRLWVTDPRYERDYLQREDGNYETGGCFLTVSLGEPFNGHCYKLIAAIMQDVEGNRR